MTGAPGHARAEAFFLQASPGQRYCLFHPPAGACRGALLYVHPFAEEMNRARRMAAQAARALAARGIGVLQIDLYGCGDSSGESGDARWDIWRADLAAASAWLRARLGHPVGLWGLRLGALLALDHARAAAEAPAALLLWQPVLSGPAFLTQFLRLRIAADMLGGAPQPQGGSEALRAALAAGTALEVAGYELAPALAAAFENLDLGALAPPPCALHWFEIGAGPGRPLAPGAAKVTGAWQAQGASLQVHQVACQPFWAIQERVESPALVAATADLYRSAQHAV